MNGAPKPAELNKGHIIRAFEAEFETRLTGVSPVAVQDPLDCKFLPIFGAPPVSVSS